MRGTARLLIIDECQVGFPIRTSRDQRVLSPPPGLSQSATSFIASCCQGIHQTPLSRLIRSRRRQALLREVVQTSTRVPFWSEVVDPTALPRQRTRRGSRVLNDPLGIRQNPRSVSFDLERLLSLQSVLRPTARHPPHLADARTASRVLLSSRCHVISRLALAIGQEGSSVDEPANQIRELVEPIGIEPMTSSLQS